MTRDDDAVPATTLAALLPDVPAALAPSIAGDAHVQAWSLILTVMPSDAPQ